MAKIVDDGKNSVMIMCALKYYKCKKKAKEQAIRVHLRVINQQTGWSSFRWHPAEMYKVHKHWGCVL